MKYNIPQEDWISPKVEIRRTPGKGKGMFAKAVINMGENVIVWGGLYVSKYELDKLNIIDEQVMQWDEDLFSVETRGISDSYFVNHSCDSNLWMDGVNTLSARREIHIGEEITCDYALWECRADYISKWDCQCGTIYCRGKVTSDDWKLETVRERYSGHFSPLILKKIAIIK